MRPILRIKLSIPQLILFTCIIATSLFVFLSYVYAQKSNCVVTKVGSPGENPTLPPGCSTETGSTGNQPGSPPATSKTGVVCPIPNGKITCGPSKPVYTNYSSCNAGHCAGDYGSPGYCGTSPGTSFAIDVPAKPNEDVYIPELTIPGESQTHPLTCIYVGATRGESNSLQIITQFDCTDTINNNKVWIQFHHILDGSAPAVGTRVKSGDPLGGKIEPDVRGGFPHVHVQIGINGGCGADYSGCVAADKYLQCT